MNERIRRLTREQALRLKADEDAHTRAHPNELRFDYDVQCWVESGVYLDCDHPAAIDCRCHGRLHAGEVARLPEVTQ